MLNFDRFTVKHGTQNIQNDCHQQWLSDTFRVHQTRFLRGLRAGPTGGAFSALPGPLTGLRGPTSKGEEERKGREGKRKRRGGTAPLSQISGSAPDLVAMLLMSFLIIK